MTNVDVVVTDKHGNRVPGLAQKDFEIYVDGVPQPITNFYSVSGGKAFLSDGKELSLTGTKEIPATASSEVPANLRAKFVFYIDNLNIDTLHRNRMFKYLETFVQNNIGPNAEGMIVTANRSLKVRQHFTSDPGVLLGALDDAEHEAGGTINMVSARQRALEQINDAKSEGEAASIATHAAREMDDDLKYTVQDLKTTIDGLAGVPGRKILVYLSDGLPQTVGEELFQTVNDKFQTGSAMMESFQFDRTASYASIIQEANSQGVTLYMIDTAGLQITSGISAENAYMVNRPNSFFLQQNFEAPLETLARETGGIAAVNTNNPTPQLDQIAKDFSDYYSLGFQSSRGATDRPHSLEVKVLKPGLRARYRAGYVDKTIETRTAEAVIAALHYPRHENPLNVSVANGDPKPYKSVNYMVPVRVSIPLSGMTLIPDGPDYRGRLYIYFVVLDSEGNQSDLQIRPLDIKVDDKHYASARKKIFPYDVQLIMIPGGQKLSVAVRDSVSGEVSFVQKSIFISVLPPASPTPAPKEKTPQTGPNSP